MKFTKYTSIENAYRQKAVFNIQQYFPNETFVVQEKIHGANFAIYVDKDGVKYAKRSGFIQNLQSFYRADIIAEKYEEKVKKLYNQLLEDYKIVSEQQGVPFFEPTLSIHGEIYGGSYPHKDVEAVKGIKSVQKGVFYSPDIEFVAFDMKVDGEYVDIETMNSTLDRFEIPRLNILKEGTLQECLEYPNAFNSNLHDLPELENNTCEGVVIKSVSPLYDPRGNRAILKNKNAKWSEKSKKVKTNTIKEIDPKIREIAETAISYVTENRLRNVISKVGPITEVKTAFGKLMKPMNLDVIEEFTKENPEFETIEKADQKLLTKIINEQIGTLIRNNLFNIVDGNF